MKRTSIKLLPVGGIENPYQQLLSAGLRDSGFDVDYGVDTKIFPFVRTAFKGADFIHVDWIHQYYIRKNAVLTFLQLFLFYSDIILTCIFFRVKLIWSIHNIFPHDRNNNIFLTLPRILFSRIVSKVRVFNPDTVATVSSKLRISRNKIAVIPEGNYIGYYPNHIAKNDSKAVLGLSANDKTILYFGSIRPYKGVENLIDAFKEISDPDWQLLIVGDVKDQEYKKLIENRASDFKRIVLRFIFVSVDEVQLYFNSCDIVALPFQNIENSGSIKLAMGFGCPIITKKTRVFSELLGKDDNFLFEKKSDFHVLLKEAMQVPTAELSLIGERNYVRVSKLSWRDTARLFV